MTAGARTSPLRVLLVDDDEVDREAVRRALRVVPEGVSVDEAEVAADALALASERTYDVVLLDYRLPDHDGLHVLTQLRAAGRRLPVVMLTGQGDEATAVGLLKAGATDYIPKALLTSERLVLSIRNGMRLHDAEARAARHLERMQQLATAAIAINASLSIGGILEEAASRARTILDARHVELIASPGASGGAAAAQSPRAGGGVLDAARVAAWLRAATLLGTATRIEGDGGDPSGADSGPWRPGSLVAPLRDEQGEVFGALMAEADPARPFEADDEAVAVQLAQMAAGAVRNAALYEEARVASRAREEIVAIVSHDLRNPLMVIATSIERLQMLLRGEGHERARDCLARARRASGTMERLIADLLDVSTIAAGRLQISPCPTTTASLLADVAETFGPLAAARSMRLVIEPAAELPDLVVDRDRVLQVFSNLIGNAVKFGPEGSRVVVRARRGPGAVVQFEVEDSGPGIPAADAARIFEQFFRGERRHDGKGAGLGLAIARGIVEAHGGNIWADAGGGAGACLRFTVPVAPATLEPARPAFGSP